MLSNNELLQSLNELERLFQAATNPRDSKMHAKHALLELCGWIEEAEDHIVLNCSRKIIDQDLKSIVEKRVKFNSSFEFDEKFLPLLGIVVGFQKYSVINSKLISTGRYFPNLLMNVNKLKIPRNNHAHTHFEDLRPSNNILQNLGPSVIKQLASDIFEGFSELERSLKRHRLM